MANPPDEAAESRFNRDWENIGDSRKQRGWDMQPAERRNRRYVRADGSSAELYASVAPAVTGTAQVGQTLTVSTGTWVPASGTSFTRKWYRDGVEISGQTGTTYVAQAGDVGKRITARVTATKTGYGNRSVLSAPTAPVIAA